MADFVEQAGAVVFRRNDEGLRFLVVRARRNPTDWIFPKGHIEDDESAAEAAVREAEEEAGVTGRVLTSLGSVKFESAGRMLRVKYFLVERSRDVIPDEERDKAWLAPSDAIDRLTHAKARGLVEQAMEFLKRSES